MLGDGAIRELLEDQRKPELRFLVKPRVSASPDGRNGILRPRRTWSADAARWPRTWSFDRSRRRLITYAQIHGEILGRVENEWTTSELRGQPARQEREGRLAVQGLRRRLARLIAGPGTPAQFIETSSPGLRGQSGVPVRSRWSAGETTETY